MEKCVKPQSIFAGSLFVWKEVQSFLACPQARKDDKGRKQRKRNGGEKEETIKGGQNLLFVEEKRRGKRRLE